MTIAASPGGSLSELNGDQSAKIVPCPGGHRDTAAIGCSVVGSLTAAWIPARRVWNQSFLSLSHVNIDMSVFVDSSPNGLTVNTSPVGGSAGSDDGCIRCRKLIVARSASRSRER